jgi:hypothetical protein
MASSSISPVAADQIYGRQINGEVIKILFELGIDRLTRIGTFDLGIATFPPALVPGLRWGSRNNFGFSVRQRGSIRADHSGGFLQSVRQVAILIADHIRASSSSIARNAMQASSLVSAV